MLNKCMKKQQEKHLRMQISKRFSTSTTWQLLMLTILWPGFQQPKRCCQCKVTSPGSTCLWRIFLRRVSCKKGKILLFWDFLFFIDYIEKWSKCYNRILDDFSSLRKYSNKSLATASQWSEKSQFHRVSWKSPKVS